MKSRILAGAALLLAALTGGLAVAGAKPLPPSSPVRVNWNTTVAQTDRDSYILGKPDAAVNLVEFISYTCPHCAAFEREATDQLRIGMVGPGKGNIEVRSFVRDPVDMTVAVLVRCGAKERFFANHAAFLRSQPQWIVPLEHMTSTQQQRWFGAPDLGARMRYIATDFHFYEKMASLGYDRTTVDRCLTNTALADRLAHQTADADEHGYVHGTPSFMLNGIVLTGTNSWAMLKPQVEARLP